MYVYGTYWSKKINLQKCAVDKGGGGPRPPNNYSLLERAILFLTFDGGVLSLAHNSCPAPTGSRTRTKRSERPTRISSLDLESSDYR